MQKVQNGKRKEKGISKKSVAVNTGPSTMWNTDTLVTEAAKGAPSAGAAVEKYDLNKLDRFTGCVSCSS